MTSATFSEIKTGRHAFREAFRQNLWLPIVALIGFIMLIPVTTAGFPASSIFNRDYTHGLTVFRFFAGRADVFVNAGVILYGIALAIFLFKFMLSKRETNVYFSLGLGRPALLAARYLAGLVMLFVPIAAAMTASLCLNLSAIGPSAALTAGFFHLTFGLLLLGLVSFAATALVFSLAGSIFEGLAGAATVLLGPTLLIFGFNGMMKLLLFGNPYGVSGHMYVSSSAGHSLVGSLSGFNPILFLLNDTDKFYSLASRSAGSVAVLPAINHWLLAGWLIVAAALTAAALLGFVKRPAERAGTLGENRGLNIVLISILSFAGFGLAVNFLGSAQPVGPAFTLLIAAIVFAVVYAVIQMILTRRLRLFVKRLVYLPAYLAVIGIAALVLATGFFGFSTREPAIDDIKSASITYAGSPNYVVAGGGSMGNDNSVYFDYPVKLTSRSDIALAASLHSDIIAAGRGGYGIKAGDIKDSFVPYYITVTYHLKSGGTETRYYDRTTLGVLQKMLVLDTADSMKKNFSTLISGQPVTNGFGIYQVSSFSTPQVTLLDSWYQNPVKLTLTQAEHTELLGCISRDVAGQTLDDRYFPKGPPVCILSFGSVGNGDFEAGSYRYDFGESYVYVTGGFTNTIDYLKQHGLAGSLSYTPKIESITLAGYVPSYSYAKLYNDGNYPESPFVMGFAATGEEAGFKLQSTVAITDSAEIGTLTPLLRNDYFMSGGGYMAMIKLEGSKNYVYKLLPAADAPTFVSARLSPEGRKS